MSGQKILDVDRKRINPKFICAKCEMLLVKPMQTVCGHLMCCDCVHTILSTSNHVCPKDGTELKQEEIFLDHFTKRELWALHLQCPNSGCDWSGSYKELQEHVDVHCLAVTVTCEQECNQTPADCDFKAIGCTHPKVAQRQDLRQHYSGGLIVHVRLLLNFVLEMFGKIHAQVKTLADRYASMLKTVTALETRVQNLESSRVNFKATPELDQMALTTGQSATSCNGTLLWRIDSVKRKRQDAVKGVQTAMYSPPFYSGQYGYKMCARIYLNGDGFGKGTHISLFFVVMKGEYDALLPWPFQKHITMMLIDQNKENHMIDTFRSDLQSSSFQRPKSNMNIASGSPLFMPVDGLTNRAYVKDDVMFIRIMVDD